MRIGHKLGQRIIDEIHGTFAPPTIVLAMPRFFKRIKLKSDTTLNGRQDI